MNNVINASNVMLVKYLKTHTSAAIAPTPVIRHTLTMTRYVHSATSRKASSPMVMCRSSSLLSRTSSHSPRMVAMSAPRSPAGSAQSTSGPSTSRPAPYFYGGNIRKLTHFISQIKMQQFSQLLCTLPYDFLTNPKICHSWKVPNES